jgi:hypothetical protein
MTLSWKARRNLIGISLSLSLAVTFGAAIIRFLGNAAVRKVDKQKYNETLLFPSESSLCDVFLDLALESPSHVQTGHVFVVDVKNIRIRSMSCRNVRGRKAGVLRAEVEKYLQSGRVYMSLDLAGTDISPKDASVRDGRALWNIGYWVSFDAQGNPLAVR